MEATISTKRAAELMGTTQESIRKIIELGIQPIGIVLPYDPKKTQRKTYKVFAYKVAELTGMPIEQVIGGKSENKNDN